MTKQRIFAFCLPLCGKHGKILLSLPMATRKVADLWLRKVLQVLYQRRTVTRSEIVAATGLNLASISHTIRYLLAHGTILKMGDLQGDGSGRRREVFTLNGEAAYFVAVDLDGPRIRFALLNAKSDIRWRWEEALDWAESLAVDKLLAGIARVVRNLEQDQRRRLVAIGISYPGLLDEHARLTAVNLGWQDFPLFSELHEKASQWELAGIPIFLEPHRHSALLAERWLGCARDYEDGLLLFTGRGAGMGLFAGGRGVEGWRKMAGEIGHITIDPSSEERCRCGKRGCLETVAATPGILRAYERRTGRQAGIEEVFDRARAGDADAVAVIEHAAAGIGLALSHAVSLLNPKVVVLGGDLAAGEDVLVPLIRAEIERHTLAGLTQGLVIKCSTLGLDMRLRGTGAFAFRKALSDGVLLKKICGPVFARAAAGG